MKRLIIIAILLIPVGARADEGEKIRNLENWLNITVRTQNVAHELERQKRLLGDAPPDPDQFDGDLKAIHHILSELVKSGELEDQVIELLPLEKLADKGIEFIYDYADSLSKKFGYFVALEMLDIGLEKRLSIYKPNQPFPLHLRLPKKQMDDFLMKAEKKGLIHKPQAQQAAPSDGDKLPN